MVSAGEGSQHTLGNVTLEMTSLGVTLKPDIQQRGGI
jgi:hypothetical protein